ncbi:MAG TPA: hypothetical protein VGG07_03470 [Solirubrobacteraceae bacterium]
MAARSAREGVLALQRRAGNRAVGQVLARRVVGTDPATRVVRLEVGYELTEKLARTAWTLTAKGPLNEAGVEQLRQVALEHYFETIDDDERLFIAALLDAANAAKLHEQYPRGFSDNGSVIEFSAASITESNRRIVRDSGRSVHPEPTESDKAFIKDPLDREIVAMTGAFRIVAMQTLKLADKAGIDHLKVYFAMINGASDSTPGDRAYAGAAYVIATSEGMPDIAREIMAQNLKIDEVSSVWFEAEGEGSHAEFVPESDGQRKGDTIYVPGTLDLDNIAHVSTLVHELQHATDAAGAASNPRDFSRVELELAAYSRQSRYMLAQLDKLAGDAQRTAEQQVAERIGPGHVYLMIAAALQTVFTDDDELWHELVTVITDVNDRAQLFSPGSGLDRGDLSRALNATADENREKARDAIRYDNKRYKRSAKVHLGGLKGESRLDRMPAGASPGGTAPAGTLMRRTLARRTLARDGDQDLATQGKRIEDAQVAAAAKDEATFQDRAAKANAQAAVDLKAGRTAVVYIGRERVRVASEQQRADAERIIAEAKSKYAVIFDSIASRRAAREEIGVGGNATDAGLKAMDAEIWDYKELKGFEAAFKHFGAILGDARRKSSLSSQPQETTRVGKLTIAADDKDITAADDSPKAADRSRGQHFKDARTAVLYRPDPSLSVNDPHYFEMHATHELAHGAFASQLDAFMKATGGWWKAKYVHGRKGEAPPDDYADTNAAEDLAQSVAYFFVDPDRLRKGDGKADPGVPGNRCPKRHDFIRRVVGGWTAKK